MTRAQASLIKDAEPVPEQPVSPATEEIEETSDVDAAADRRDFQFLGGGTAGWLGSGVTAATHRSTIELKLSLLIQVRMEPVQWAHADGLRCDRQFHAHRVLLQPVFVQIGSGSTCTNTV